MYNIDTNKIPISTIYIRNTDRSGVKVVSTHILDIAIQNKLSLYLRVVAIMAAHLLQTTCTKGSISLI